MEQKERPALELGAVEELRVLRKPALDAENHQRTAIKYAERERVPLTGDGDPSQRGGESAHDASGENGLRTARIHAGWEQVRGDRNDEDTAGEDG